MEGFEMAGLLNVGMLLTLFGYVAYQLKAIPLQIWDKIKEKLSYSVYVEHTDKLYLYLERYLQHKHSRLYREVEATIGDKFDRFGSKNRFGEDDKPIKERRIKVSYWQLDGIFLIWYKRRLLFISKGRKELTHAQEATNLYLNSYTIRGLKSKKVIMNLMEEVVEFNKQFEQEVPPKIKVNELDYFRVSGDVTGKDMDHVFFDNKDTLIADIDLFISRREWYHERGIPYKRGYLFAGSPGNGKTTLTMAIAKRYGRDVYFISLNDVTSDRELRSLFNDIEVGNCIVVFEDIDSCFTKRKGEKKVSFSGILNCLDGAFYKDGMITIMTTNKPEQLDPALIREGRIDFKLEMSNPPGELVKNYVQKFYADNSLSLNIENYKKNLSMVAVQEICIKNLNDPKEAMKWIEAATQTEKLLEETVSNDK